MGIKFEKEGSTCEWCGKDNTKCTYSEKLDVIGKILLCAECAKKDKENRETKCHNCNELVWSKGGLRKHDGKKYCSECITEILKKRESRKKVFDFIKRHWAKWISFGIGITAIIIGYYIATS